MSAGWGMRWHDDGRPEMRGPGESKFEAVAVVGFELDDLHLLEEALESALQRLGSPPRGVGGLDRPMTEHDEVDRLLRTIQHAKGNAPVATF